MVIEHQQIDISPRRMGSQVKVIGDGCILIDFENASDILGLSQKTLNYSA